jgi:hypothetical protein
MTVAAAIAPLGRIADILAHVRNDVRVHALLHVVALTVCALGFIEAAWLGMPFDLHVVTTFTGPTLQILAMMILCGLALETARLARFSHEGSVLEALGRKVWSDYLAPARLSHGLHTAIFLSVFMAGYALTKKAIPLIHPFAWDETFMRWGKDLHFGLHPYQVLAPILNVPVITYGLSLVYIIWFPVMFCSWLWQGFERRDNALRLQFFLSFMLTWFFGTSVLGTLFSSAGPGFYGRLIPGPDPYAPLLAWLAEANSSYPIWSVPVMDELWKIHTLGVPGTNGISAMPSMHVATSVLLGILGFASGRRWLGWLLSAFAVLVFFGSIHLGWHYAVDDYAGAVVAASSWWIAGKLVAWDRRRRSAVNSRPS